MSGVPENCNRRWPSSFVSTTVAQMPVDFRLGHERRFACRPARVWPGRSIAHQSLRAFSSSSRISNRPPVRAFDAAQAGRGSRANCSAPARRRREKIPASRGNLRCSMRPPSRCKTRSRDSSRRGAGCCAINSGGRTKSKSAVRIARVSSFSCDDASCQDRMQNEFFGQISSKGCE